MSKGNRYTIYAGSIAELSEAAGMVDRCMNNGTGHNEIRYRLDNGRELGYDTGFITDGALDELARSFCVLRD